MRKLVSLALAVAMICPLAASAKKNDEGLVPHYQLEGAGMTSDNSKQVTVTIITKKKDKVTDSDLERAGVHGVLFRDFDDATNAGFGSVASHKAIMSSPTDEAKEAINRKYSEFKGKKGDFTGMFLRLKKKK